MDESLNIKDISWKENLLFALIIQKTNLFFIFDSHPPSPTDLLSELQSLFQDGMCDYGIVQSFYENGNGWMNVDSIIEEYRDLMHDAYFIRQHVSQLAKITK